MPARKSQTGSLEKSLEKLESIVQMLEKGNVPLEESIGLFEEGTQLSIQCHRRLSELENRVQVVVEKAKGELSKVSLEEFEEEDD